MKKDIFISYSRKDIQQVRAFKQELEEATHASCWMDLEGIESGTPRFTKAIINAINSCPIFLFMLSDASQKSENALKELDFAYKKHREEGKNVVIVRLDDSQMTDEFSFDYGKADTIDWRNKYQHDKLIRDILRWIEPQKKAGLSGDVTSTNKKEAISVNQLSPNPKNKKDSPKAIIWYKSKGCFIAITLIGLLIIVIVPISLWTVGNNRSGMDDEALKQQLLAYNDSIVRVKFNQGKAEESHGDSLAALDEAKEIPDHLEDHYIQALNIYSQLMTDTLTHISPILMREIDSQQSALRNKMEMWQTDFNISGNTILALMPEIGEVYLARSQKIAEALITPSQP